MLSTFSRLLIDPNRGADDPTLVMRFSDGAIVPGNARADAAEIERRRERYWAPYREAVAATIEAMLASREPPAIVSIHSFTPVWRGVARRWKVGVLWDLDDRVPRPLLQALEREGDLHAHGIGDNEPYDGGLMGDTIDAVATARGLANALIEVRQDLIAEQAGARPGPTAWRACSSPSSPTGRSARQRPLAAAPGRAGRRRMRRRRRAGPARRHAQGAPGGAPPKNKNRYKLPSLRPVSSTGLRPRP